MIDELSRVCYSIHPIFTLSLHRLWTDLAANLPTNVVKLASLYIFIFTMAQR